MVEKRIIQGVSILLYAVSAIGISIGAPEKKGLIPALFGSVLVLLYFYHLKSKGSSLGGYQIDNTFVIPLFLVVCVVFFSAITNSETPNIYNEQATEISSCKQTGNIRGADADLTVGAGRACKIKNLGQMNVFTSTQFIIVYLVIFSSAFIIYEIALKNGIQEALLRSISIICIAFLIISISYVLLSLGDPLQDYSGLTSQKLNDMRNSFIFKGSITSSDYKPDQNISIVYKGNNTKVRIKKGTIEEEIDCSTASSTGNSLWACSKDESLNRIESKCGGDWWLSTNKGCLSDGFFEFYRYFYILLMFVLISITMYSIFKSPNYYSLKGLLPLFLAYGIIIGYHLIYLISNFIVSWTTNEAVLFQKFTSEFLKGIDGFWSESSTCNEKFDTEKSPEMHTINNYTSIWSNDSVSSKIKILFNIVLLICVIGLSIKYIGSKYIQPQINKLESLESSLKTVYMYLITTIASLGGLQIIYLLYTTLVADNCIVDRITQGVSIDKKETQKYCKGKNPENNPYCEQLGVTATDALTKNASKKDNTSGYTKKHCKDDNSCVYDNSFTMNELIRCQLDSHGGLYYHLVFMIMIPMLFTLIKSTSIIDLIK